MTDATRSIGSDGLIPVPRRIASVRAHSERDADGEHGEQEFAEEFKTLKPMANRRRLSTDSRDQGTSRWIRTRSDRRNEGLGSDLDLLG